MHDMIAGPQLFEVEQRGAFDAWLDLAMGARLAEDFLFGIEVEAVGLEHHAGGNFTLDDRGTKIRPFEQLGK